MKCYGVKINFKEFHFLDYSDISLGSTVGALSHVTIRRSQFTEMSYIYGSGHEGWAVTLPGFATSFWRNNGVSITSCVRYDDENVQSVTKIWLTWHLRFSVHNNDTFRSVSRGVAWYVLMLRPSSTFLLQTFSTVIFALEVFIFLIFWSWGPGLSAAA